MYSCLKFEILLRNLGFVHFFCIAKKKRTKENASRFLGDFATFTKVANRGSDYAACSFPISIGTHLRKSDHYL
ncbi:hypothetical protein SAMN05216474_0782 [Lishizhenia tianjinensis]|uniref:Uncharacterized protein n=1 Tax=Lishizhenia tianjinensis TaxID=477690 RepID=A0A1I6YBW1_9FLAO|nr:hypothetical protein SAMN05216474_0782 [Lishizhenia tianjinensis]